MKNLLLIFILLFIPALNSPADSLTAINPAPEPVQDSLVERIGLELLLSADFDVITEKEFDETLGKIIRSSDEGITVDFGADFTPADGVKGSVLFCWDGERSAALDEAFIFFGDSEAFPGYIGGGKMTVPFGLYSSALISDTLTQETGETVTRMLALGTNWRNFHFSAFVYDGKSLPEDNGHSLDSPGLNINYEKIDEDSVLLTGVGWIENLFDSDVLSEYLVTEDIVLREEVEAMAAYFRFGHGSYMMTLEYITGLESPYFFESPLSLKQQRPTSWDAEASYTFDMGGKEVTLSALYGESDGLQDILPESRTGSNLTFNYDDHISMALEFIRDKDYSIQDGGNGYDNELIAFQLSYEY